MKRQSFGKTWWGNSWVEAMERIDYNTNRLPRGRIYANNGSVRQIDIKDAQAFAKVQGSRPRPYNIKINLKRFSNPKVKQVKEVIASNPAIASELSLGKLPQSLLTTLDKLKIHILPYKWDDISADCSCPDWANPCKHLAAVYYIIADEIDKNPFLIFNLRGISTESLIEAAGFTAERSGARGQRSEIFAPYEQIYNLPLKEEIYQTEPPDISFTPLDIESIFSLLQDKPLFYYNGNFKKILLQAYKAVANKIEAVEINEDGVSFKGTDFYLIYKGDVVLYFVSPSDALPVDIKGKTTSLKLPVISDSRLTMAKIKGRIISAGDIFSLFISLPFDTTMDNNSLSSRFLNASTSIALAIIRSASFIPEVVLKGNQAFSIRYVPLLHDDRIKEAIAYLKAIMPLNLGIRESDGSLMVRDGIYGVLSLILTYIIHRCADIDDAYDRGDKLCNAFFRGDAYSPERFEERQTAKAVSDWLERLSIRKKDISPVIRIEAGRKDKFVLRIDVENKKDPLAPIIPLLKIFDSKGEIFSYPAEEVRTDVSRQISIASEYMPPLRDILNSRGKKDAAISPFEMAGFMTDSSNILTLLGIRAIIPKGLKNLLLPRIAVKAEASGCSLSYLSLDSMLNFSWEIAIGDKAISKEEFLKLAKSANGIVRFKDQYLLLKPEEIKNILDKINKPSPKLSSMDILHSAFTGEFNGMLFNPDDRVKGILNNITKIEEIAIPEKLNGHLRPYQERGFKWLYSNTVKGFGSCIADDMGLGKTIQVITLILRLKEDKRLNGPVLIVCPTTLLGNWYKECQRFAPSLNAFIYHGTERSLKIEEKDVIITTYGILRRDIDRFRDRRFGLAVIDEAQNIKNPDTDQTKAVKSIPADSYIAMSGTPVENRLTEIWSIFDFINRGYIGEIRRFHREYAVPIEKYRDKERIERLRRATAPFLLRRLKTDKSIITDLPDKVIFDEYCYLTKEQAALYKQVVDMVMKDIEESEGIERRGLIFKLITALKQICNHPVHYSKKGRHLKELSGKAEKAVRIIENVLAMKEKALIFTQYKEMGDILGQIIKDELNEEAPFFHGGVTRGKRDRMVEEFQTEESIRLMIISIKAGGTGINLTAATNVIHYDLWWNPAVEAQATDRTYRIGQEKNVTVHRLITIGTFEERIDEMIKAKKELADLTVSTGEKWITELSNKELKEIFSLGKG